TLNHCCYLKDIGGSLSIMHSLNRGPPLCLQIISLIIMVSFGLYSIMKGMSFGLFSWWSSEKNYNQQHGGCEPESCDITTSTLLVWGYDMGTSQNVQSIKI
ncbi:hypothetical protein GDO81_001531, partial [Engystomops pustulosus]